MYKDFTEMPVWEMSQGIIREVYTITHDLPRSEDYALTSQIRRASLSVAGNIAEAFGRGHSKDKINFYLFSRGSAFEVKAYLLTGVTLKYFVEEKTNLIIRLLGQIIESLNRLIKTLRLSS